jgi:hypothetical protein
MTKYKLQIYGLEKAEEFEKENEAEDRQEYLERVQNKICRIEVIEDG